MDFENGYCIYSRNEAGGVVGAIPHKSMGYYIL